MQPTVTTLKDFATPLAARDRFIKIGIGGFAGSGKSTTGSHLIAGAYKDLKLTKPVLMIDNEKGSRFLIPFFEKQGIQVMAKETTSLADVLAAFEFLEKGEIDFLYIDTLTKVYYQYIRDYRRANGHFKDGRWVKFMQLNDWGKVLPAWQEDFSDRFVNVKGNIVFTGRGGYEYEKEEDEKDEDGRVTKKGTFVKSGVKMKLAGETPFEPDLNLWMEQEQEITAGALSQWREAHVMKDRSGLIDGKVFKNPTYEHFKPVIDFLMGLKIGAMAGPTSNENLAPSEDFGNMRQRQARDIEVEKLKAVFEKAAFGTSVADKQLKVVIYEKIFGTTSSLEIEKFDAERLRSCRETLERLLVRLQNVVPEAKVETVKSWNPAESELAFDQKMDAKPVAAAQPDTAVEFNDLMERVKLAKSEKVLAKAEDFAKSYLHEKRLTQDQHDTIVKAIGEKRQKSKAA